MPDTSGADPRMRRAAEQRQVYLTSRSRPLTPQDLSTFDYIIGMDAKNVADMQVGLIRSIECGSSISGGIDPVLGAYESHLPCCVGQIVSDRRVPWAGGS